MSNTKIAGGLTEAEKNKNFESIVVDNSNDDVLDLSTLSGGLEQANVGTILNDDDGSNSSFLEENVVPLFVLLTSVLILIALFRLAGKLK